MAQLAYPSVTNSVALGLAGGNDMEKKDVICPDVWGYFYDEHDATHGRSYLEDLHERLIAYHNLGGNYEALSSFMSKSVDATARNFESKMKAIAVGTTSANSLASSRGRSTNGTRNSSATDGR